MLRLLKAVGIPLVCLAALAGAIYLVWEADQRWERQRLERRETIGTFGMRQSPDAAAAGSADAGSASEASTDEAHPAGDAPVDQPHEFSDPPVLESWESNGRTPPPLVQLDRPPAVEPRDTSSQGEQVTREPLSAEELQDRIRLVTVRISHPELGPLGGGVIISRSRTGFEVLTAQHVIDGLETIKVSTFHRSDRSGGEWIERNYTARGAVKSDSLTDLALLRINSVLQPDLHLEVAGGGDELPETAWALLGGFEGPPSAEEVMLGGRQQARRQFDSPPVSYWRVMRPSEHGTSGSGLVNSFGELIGIASGNSSGMAFYSDEIEIRKFLGQKR